MTISRSLRITAALPSAIATLLDLALQCRQTLFEVEGGEHPRQLKPQLHECDGNRRLKARDHDARPHQTGHRGNITDQPPDEAIDNFNRGQIQNQASRACLEDALKEIIFELHGRCVVQRRLDRRDEDIAYFQDWNTEAFQTGPPKATIK